jgi:hypothetical protein
MLDVLSDALILPEFVKPLYSDFTKKFKLLMHAVKLAMLSSSTHVCLWLCYIQLHKCAFDYAIFKYTCVPLAMLSSSTHVYVIFKYAYKLCYLTMLFSTKHVWYLTMWSSCTHVCMQFGLTVFKYSWIWLCCLQVTMYAIWLWYFQVRMYFIYPCYFQEHMYAIWLCCLQVIMYSLWLCDIVKYVCTSMLFSFSKICSDANLYDIN